MLFVFQSAKAAKLVHAVASVGAEPLVVAVLVAMNSTAQAWGSELVAIKQTLPQMEPVTEEEKQRYQIWSSKGTNSMWSSKIGD